MYQFVSLHRDTKVTLGLKVQMVRKEARYDNPSSDVQGIFRYIPTQSKHNMYTYMQTAGPRLRTGTVTQSKINFEFSVFLQIIF